MLFDVLHADGEDLLDTPGAAARTRSRRRPRELRIPRRVADDAAGAGALLEAALAMGHEGVIVKALEAPYAAGRRGAGWLKVKPRTRSTSWCSRPSGATAAAGAG